MENKEFLRELLDTPSPSGYERLGGIEVFKKFCRGINRAVEKFTDTMGNCAFYVGPENPETTIMISGHIDEIGLQVSMITEEGMLNVVSLGGIDKKCLLGQEVEVISSSGKIIPGIIGKKPIHIEYGEDDYYDRSLIKIKDVLVDIGECDKKSVESLVHIGDPIVIKRNSNLEFGSSGNRIMSKGLDDKIGVYITALVLKKLSENRDNLILGNCGVWCVANTQEEVGLRGAMRSAKIINPKYSIDIDVTFSTDEGRGIEKEIYGDIKLGNGPVIMHGPDKSVMLNRIIRDVCEDNKIPYQESVSGAGGTNTAAIQEFSYDTETTHIGIPLRNMHTPVEICSWNDVDSSIDLIYSTIKKLYE